MQREPQDGNLCQAPTPKGTVTFYVDNNIFGPPIELHTAGRAAPRGYYMLFILNGNGVPSVGKFVHLH
ncbi:MAG: galactose oxidase-like domain-containing protein [Pyrinomonadaceae bacterium]